MTSRQIDLIQNSWDFVITNTNEAGKIFYERLFEESPDLRSLFKEDMKKQEKKLIDLITFAVSKVDNIESIIKDVEALGTRHKGYSVKEEHYDNVASALLWTLEHGLGSQWNEEHKQAWTDLYVLLSSVMKKAPEKLG